MARRTEQTLVRFLIAAVLLVAIVAAGRAPTSSLPAVALGQAWLYRLEVSLLTFYSCLLLITPAFSGLIRGRLPIEISTRGARFAEEADRFAALDEVTIWELEETIGDLTQALASAQIEIGQLNDIVGSVVGSDNTQREVDSKR